MTTQANKNLEISPFGDLDLLDDVGIWEYGVLNDELVWNKGMFAIYGVKSSAFNHSYAEWKNALLPQDVEAAEEAFNRSLTTGTFKYQFRIVHPKQGVRHIKATAVAIKKDGKAVKVVGTNIDVTDYIGDVSQERMIAGTFKAFIEQTPNAVAMFNKDMEYIAASDAWLSDYHITRDVIGRSHYEVFPEIGDDWKAIHRKCLKGHIDVNNEATFVRDDGSIQKLRWHVRPWRHENNEIGGIIMFTEDLTEIHQERRERAKLDEVLLETQSVAKIGAWRVDVIKGKPYWDKITRQIHEVPDDFVPDLEGAMNFYKKGYSRNEVQRMINRAVEHKEPFNFELQLTTYNGKDKWVRSIGKPIVDSSGKVVELSGIFQDIDEQKKKEIENKIIKEQFENAFSHSAIGMALVSIEGKWLKVNNECSNIFGYPKDELLTKTFQELTHEEDLGKDLELLKDTIAGKRSAYRLPKRYYRKDGETIWTMLSVSIVRGASEEPLYFVSQIEDITKRVKYEQSLKKANKDLSLLTDKLSLQNKSLSDFAHITSHNLRSPVSNIVTLQEIYKESESEDEKAEIQDKLFQTTNHLKETLNELIEALIVQDSAGENFEKIALTEVINAVVANFEGIVQKKKADIKLNGNQDLKVLGNKHYIYSVVQNLVSNALKYARPNVPPIINIELIDDGKYAVFKVKDNGLGINLARHGRKLFGLHKTFHRNEDAKGVGLFMVKTQVESMGGTIKVESEPEKGSIFTVQLPKP